MINLSRNPTKWICLLTTFFAVLPAISDDECGDILRQSGGIFNFVNLNTSTTMAESFQQSLASMTRVDTGTAVESGLDVQYYPEGSTQPVTLGANFSDDEWSSYREAINDDRLYTREETYYYSMAARFASPELVNAWETCMRQKTFRQGVGLRFRHLDEEGTTRRIEVEWRQIGKPDGANRFATIIGNPSTIECELVTNLQDIESRFDSNNPVILTFSIPDISKDAYFGFNTDKGPVSGRFEAIPFEPPVEKVNRYDLHVRPVLFGIKDVAETLPYIYLQIEFYDKDLFDENDQMRRARKYRTRATYAGTVMPNQAPITNLDFPTTTRYILFTATGPRRSTVANQKDHEENRIYQSFADFEVDVHPFSKTLEQGYNWSGVTVRSNKVRARDTGSFGNTCDWNFSPNQYFEYLVRMDD